MTAAKRDIEINVSPENFYSVLVDFEAYPRFLRDVDEVKVHSRDGDNAVITQYVKVIKSIGMTIRLEGEVGKKLHWTLQDSKWMVKNDGGWDLEALPDGRTKATYGVEVEVHIPRLLRKLVPSDLQQRLVEKTFPAMLNQFKDRAESIHPPVV